MKASGSTSAKEKSYCTKYIMMRATTTAMPMLHERRLTHLPSQSSCSLSGVFTLLSICAALYTLPFSVASPTAVTCIRAWPSITLVPRSTRLLGYVALESNCAGSVVLRQSGSPVSVDSSTESCVDSKRSPSAGISQPMPIRTTSPTTTSRFAICV